MSKQTGRIASLDGLRTISIGLVLIGHLAGTRFFPLTQEAGDFFALAETGVLIFFVISGFLITTLLLHELDKSGRINLLKFYFRRTLRIFPPYYSLIAVLLVLRFLGYISLSNYDVFHALTYTSNYFYPEGWYLGHTWSLSVEEQFYLLWPAILLLSGKRKGWLVAASLLVLCPLVRTLALFDIWHHTNSSAFEMLADSLACGCLLALWRTRLHENKWYRAALNSSFFWLLPLMILVISAFHRSTKIYYTIGLTFTNIGVALCLDWCVTWSEGKVGRILNSRVIAYVGTLSYSIYLWQQLFINRNSDAIIASFPLNIILAALTAMASYYFIEKPSLQWRQRLETKLL